MAPATERASAAPSTALLLAAHGERRPDAGNESVFRIARALTDRGLAVAVGFISGVPSIKDALDSLAADRILVYPLFASSGYFSRDRLVQILDEAGHDGRNIEMLTPLGLDPGLPDIVLQQARDAAQGHGFAAEACTVILLAHGSQRNPASRQSTEQMAQAISQRAIFRKVEVAFLEEAPALDDVAATIDGPGVVVGMFSGEGLHGAKDAPRLVERLHRNDIVFAGIMGAAPGVAELVARAVIARQAG
jgi:sirohydrochlorin ferrochelatase